MFFRCITLLYYKTVCLHCFRDKYNTRFQVWQSRYLCRVASRSNSPFKTRPYVITKEPMLHFFNSSIISLLLSLLFHRSCGWCSGRAGDYGLDYLLHHSGSPHAIFHFPNVLSYLFQQANLLLYDRIGSSSSLKCIYL